MLMCSDDPDVVRWQLYQLMDNGLCDVHCTNCSRGSGTDRNITVEAETSAVNCRLDQDIVDSDEVIAHILQEELQQVANAEAAGASTSNEWQQKQHTAVLSQDWLGSKANSLNSGAYSGSPVMANSEDHKYQSEDLSDFDVQVGKRLNQMVPIPHVPKVNGEVPSIDEATLDHQRLLDRLQLYDLIEFKVEGDGNCQFRSLSHQLYRTQDEHKSVREQVVNQLRKHHELYEGYVPMDFDDYLEKMSRNREWGDHITLQAAADWYGVKIFILTSYKDTCYIEILPAVQKSNRVIILSFWAEVHYNSIYPPGESLPPVKKSNWWPW